MNVPRLQLVFQNLLHNGMDLPLLFTLFPQQNWQLCSPSRKGITCFLKAGISLRHLHAFFLFGISYYHSTYSLCIRAQLSHTSLATSPCIRGNYHYPYSPPIVTGFTNNSYHLLLPVLGISSAILTHAFWWHLPTSGLSL